LVDWRAKSKRKMNDGVVYIAHPSGARACVHLHGAHLTSWKTANGTEQIFLSKKAIFEPPKAIRGGVPVCFPQFSDFGELSKSHGFARNERWTLFEREGDTVTLKLSSNDGVDFDSKYGCKDHFVISLKYTINETQISTQLEVTNTSPTSAMTYSLALHTYLRVEDITHTSIQGLYRVGYLDSLDGREMKSGESSDTRHHHNLFQMPRGSESPSSSTTRRGTRAFEIKSPPSTISEARAAETES